MRKNVWKWVLVVLTVAVLAGVVAYAAKDEALRLPVAVRAALAKAYPGMTTTKTMTTRRKPGVFRRHRSS